MNTFCYNVFPFAGDVEVIKINYCERFLELLISLEAQLPTRRFFNVLMDAAHVVVKSEGSDLHKRDDGKLFVQVCMQETW